MALRKVLQDPNPKLRKKSRPVTEITPHIHELLDDMLETMREDEGVGLAAPQVGVLRRVVVIEIEDKVYELINPEIISSEGEQTGREACLSVEDRMGIVTRPKKVTVKALDRNGNEQIIEGEDLLARCLCHELDHLDGILYIDKMIREVDPEGEDGEDEEE